MGSYKDQPTWTLVTLPDLYQRDFEAQNNSLDDTDGKNVSWDELTFHAQTLPQYEQEAHQEIRKYLGYLPNFNILVPHESFIRTLIQKRRANQISESVYDDLIRKNVMHIRNDDTVKSGWTKDMKCSDDNLRLYETYLPETIERTHKRIKKFFGYMPKFEHRFAPELILRRLVASDLFREDLPYQEADYRTFTFINYRRVLAEQGSLQADGSPLMTE